MEFKSMRFSVEDGVARLVFTQAARGNPIDAHFCSDICDVANLLSERSDVRAVLITSEGKAFSYGGDVSMFMSSLDELPLQIKKWTSDLHMGIARLQRLDAPIIVSVHGVCAGGMTGIMAGADILVAAEEAKFVAAYSGIGFCVDAGTSIMLSRRMGLSRARRFILLNETLTAQQALQAGLIDEVVAKGDLESRTNALAAQLAKGPTRSFGETRRLFLSAASTPMETQLELEAQALARMTGTADAREGLTAFVERRPANFTGR